MTSCTVYVRNIGKTAVSIDNVFISLSDGSGPLHIYSQSVGFPFFASPVNSVIQGDLITINVPMLGFSPASYETYIVKAFTSRGVGDAYQVVT